MRLDFPGYVGTIDLYMHVLRAICGDTAGKSMIDIGCAFAPNTPKLGFEHRKYIDVIDRKLDHKEEQKYFFQGDILLTIWPSDKHWDVSIASDVIEHFLLSDGRRLIQIMQQCSKKQIIFTPIGEIFKLADPDNKDPEAHRSLWEPEDFPGWATIVFPDYHKVWNGGAFFAWHCEDIENDFERVKKAMHGISQ